MPSDKHSHQVHHNLCHISKQRILLMYHIPTNMYKTPISSVIKCTGHSPQENLNIYVLYPYIVFSTLQSSFFVLQEIIVSIKCYSHI